MEHDGIATALNHLEDYVRRLERANAVQDRELTHLERIADLMEARVKARGGYPNGAQGGAPPPPGQ